jgi:hypothetical protein
MSHEFEAENGTTREELVERVALMEAMIAEGRQTTGRAGWIFVMWGVLYFVATGWANFGSHQEWAWPVCMTTGVVVLVGRRQRGGDARAMRSRTIESVWWMAGTATGLFSVFGGITHHSGHGILSLYLAAILFFIGMAHAISAAILRWAAQGLAAAVWWGGGIAVLFASSPRMMTDVFLAVTFFGQILFGLYAMLQERRRAVQPAVLRHG